MIVPTFELLLVYGTPLNIPEITLRHANDGARVVHTLIGNADREKFVVVCLNPQNNISGAYIAGVGHQSRIYLEPSTVFRAAIMYGARAIIVGHNHPAGKPHPSKEDFDITETLAKSGKIIDIPIVDHIIVTPVPGLHYSMLQEGTLYNAE